MHQRGHFTSFACLLLLLALAVPVRAQFKASIQGTVQDPTGAVVPGATITVLNQETGVTTKTVSSNEGFYRVGALPPGRYTVAVEAASFQKSVTKDLLVNAETARGFDVSLKPGAAAETVTVTETASGVQTENGNISGNISSQQVQRLPQTGRDPYNLVRLTPGVFGDAARTANGQAMNLPSQVGPGGSNSQIFQTENQVQVIANGQRVSANSVQLDGVSVNSLGQGGAAVITPSIESVKEVVVVTNSYSAEDGRNSGAQIKVISQNGTNTMHGSGFVKFNDKGLNAYNKYYGRTNVPLHELTCQTGTPSEFKITADACPSRVDQRYRQFGGKVGGPILKNKLFYFFSYEGVRNKASQIDRDVKIETPEFRKYVQQMNPNSLAAKLFGMSGIEPRVESIRQQSDFGSFDTTHPLGAWYLPGNTPGVGQAVGNGPDGIPDWAFADIRVPLQQAGNQYNGRLDYSHNNDQFFTSIYWVDFTDQGGGHRPIEEVAKQPHNAAGTLSWNRTVSATLLNEARANFTRFTFDQMNSGTNWGIPQIRLFDWDSGLGDGYQIGPQRSSTTPSRQTQNTYEVRDTLTWVHARHALKLGGEFRREQDNNDLSGGARPDYQFRGLLNFANDACCFYEGIDVDPRTGGKPDGQRYFRTSSYAWFLQDDWKVRQNLTLNLGIRWEYFPPLTETQDRVSNYILGAGVDTLPANFLYPGLVNGAVKATNNLFQPDRNNFAPRIGFAWSPKGSDKNVVRGGFGIAYNRAFDTVYTNIRQNTPYFASVGMCCFFDPGAIVGPPPGSHIQYGFGATSSPFSYPVNSSLAYGVAPDGALCGDAGCTSTTPVDIYGALRQEPNPYVYVYSLEWQNEFARNWTMSIGYQGSASHKLIRTVDMNRMNPGDTFGDHNRDRLQNFSADGVACGPTNPLCAAAHPTGNARFNRIFLPLPDVNANYNALVTRLSHRLSHGIELDATYRYSKSLDPSSFEIGAQQTDPSSNALNYGPSDYDVAHSFTLSAIWDVPLFRDRTDFVGKAFGGWQINTIATAHSGFPWTPVVYGDEATDLNGDGFRPDRPTKFIGGPIGTNFINGIFNGSGSAYFDTTTPGPAGIGRNSFRGPKYFNIDLSLAKEFGLPKMPVFGEQSKLQVRADFFNAFNRLNLAPIANGSCNADTGNTYCFGRSGSGLSGRVVELQARFTF